MNQSYPPLLPSVAVGVNIGLKTFAINVVKVVKIVKDVKVVKVVGVNIGSKTFLCRLSQALM